MLVYSPIISEFWIYLHLLHPKSVKKELKMYIFAFQFIYIYFLFSAVYILFLLLSEQKKTYRSVKSFSYSGIASFLQLVEYNLSPAYSDIDGRELFAGKIYIQNQPGDRLQKKKIGTDRRHIFQSGAVGIL